MEPNVSTNRGTSSGNYNHGNQLQMPNNLMLHNSNNLSQENPSDDKSNKTNFHVGASPTSLQNLMNFADGIQFSDEEDVERSGKTGAPPLQLQLMGENNEIQDSGEGVEYKSKSNGNKRKRPRTMKSTEEVESQRMIHIAVERNRRKQMNEHLNVLKSLMPRSYVQRGDQASIIGGAIEFVKELEQLLQCLESQKRRRLYGDEDCPKLPVIGESSNAIQQQPQHQNPLLPSPFLLPAAPMETTDDPLKFDLDYEAFQQLQEETAESKSFVADVQVKLLGLDIAMIKILSRRRHGQLINTIAALEKMQFDILQTNVTTIEQTVLYSFHVKVEGEVRYTAEDIANFVQQTFSFIHENTNVVM